MAKKKTQSLNDFIQERKEREEKTIQGSFVLAIDMNTEKLTAVKLTEIKTIELGGCFEDNEDDYCYFNTYKDHKYQAWVTMHKLMKIINTLTNKKTSND